MKFLRKTRNKIILIILISILVFAAWESGLEVIYARTLVGTSNVVLSIVKDETHIELEKNYDKYQFRVYTLVQGMKGHYPQELGGLLQPFVIVLSWQIFLFFVLRIRTAFASLGMNVGTFLLIQVFLLYLLTGYYNAETNKFIYTSMLDSFYVIAVILVIKDNLLYRVFGKSVFLRKAVQ